MAGTVGQSIADIEKKLTNKSSAFSFFQTLRLLGHLSSNGRPHPESVRVAPNLSLAFPACDVERVEKKTGYYQVTANLLGLYGTCSPLPTFYTEDFITDMDNGHTAPKDMTDVINNRLYKLLYEGWAKYRSMIRAIEDNDTDHQDVLFSLVGLGDKTLRDRAENPVKMMRYAGLLAIGTRSAAGLEILLKETFPDITVSIEQNVERNGSIPQDQRSVLGGQRICLGVQSHIGSQYKDRTGGFRVHLKALSEDNYRSFFPGKSGYEKMAGIISFYLQKSYAYDIELTMDASVQVEPMCLGGDKWSRLGLDTWICTETADVDNTMRFASPA